MKILNKRYFNILAIILLLIPVSLILVQSNCNYETQELCRQHWNLIGQIGLITVFPLFSAFVLNLIASVILTTRYINWSRFAVWSVPLLTIFTWWVFSQPSGGGVGVVGSEVFYLPLVILVYSLYFLTSFIIIGVSWWKGRKT